MRRLTNKTSIVVALGAAIGFKNLVSISKLSDLKQTLGTSMGIQAAPATTRSLPRGPCVSPMSDIIKPSHAVKKEAAGEGLRMVVFLSCWGPN